LILVNTLSC